MKSRNQRKSPVQPRPMYEFLKPIDKNRRVNTVDDLRAAYPGQFDRIGKFLASITLFSKKEVVQLYMRHASPHTLERRIKARVGRHGKKGVIKKMTKPTDWVSSLVISRRKNGKLGVCLDPKDLSKVIKRCHHKTPTLEEITHILQKPLMKHSLF